MKTQEEIKSIIKELEYLSNESCKAQKKLLNKKISHERFLENQFKEEFAFYFKKNTCYVLESFKQNKNDEIKIGIYFYGVCGDKSGFNYSELYDDLTWCGNFFVDVLELKQFIKNFEEKYECWVEIVFKHKKILNDLKEIESFEDLQIIYGEKVILIENGIVEYRGWDIANPWMLVKIDGVFVIFYANDAHSSNYNEFVKPHDYKALNKFVEHIRNENQNIFFNLGYESKIKNNWNDNKNKDFNYLFDYSCFAL